MGSYPQISEHMFPPLEMQGNCTLLVKGTNQGLLLAVVKLIDNHIVLVVEANVEKQSIYLSETSLSYKLAWPGVILGKRHLPHVTRPPSKPQFLQQLHYSSENKYSFGKLRISETQIHYPWPRVYAFRHGPAGLTANVRGHGISCGISL